MNPSLDPVLQHRLEVLGHRWRRLVLLRGSSGALATLLGALIAVALLDWLLVMPDWLRWTLSTTAYLGTALMFWLIAGRFLLHAPGPRQLARLAESADPKFREILLAAVELPEGETRWDSPVFRHLLQKAVTLRLHDLSDETVLPRRIARRWLGAAALTVALLAGLWLVPDFHFDRMFVRAAVPAANVERVSRTRIHLLAPGIQTGVVPRGDAIPVVIEVSGAAADTATLEVFRPGKTIERVTMLTSAPGQFTGALMADEPRLSYRILAGDALTKRYNLATQPRPRVVQFEKTYKYPTYTRRQERRVTEENGDLAALEGSELELLLHVDQPVRSGVLQLQLGAGGSQIQLQPAGDLRLATRFPLNLGGTYKVKLVSAATGFENALAPQYEIKLTPDVVPRVELLEPGKDLLVPADEQLRVVGRAEDDFGLAKVTQATRVNGGEWTETVIASPTNLQVVVTQQWDLATLKVKPGDQIMAKLVATDLKGNRSESPPAKITIASAGFDLRRLQAVEARKRLQDGVAELAKVVREVERATGDAGTRSRPEELLANQARLGLHPDLDEADRLAEAALARLKAALPKVRAGREAADLAVAGVALAQVRHELLPAIRAELVASGIASTKGTPAPEPQPPAIATIRRAVEITRGVESSLGNLLAAEQSDVSSESLGFLVNDQTRLTQRAARLGADQKESWIEIVHKLESSSREARSVESQLQAWSSRLPVALAQRTKKAATTLGQNRTILDRSLAALKNPRDAARLATSFLKSLEAASLEFAAVRNDASRAADRVRENLRAMAGGGFNALNKLATTDAMGAGEAITQRAWDAAVAQLKARAQIDEARPDSDAQFVADFAQAAEALSASQGVHGPAEGQPPTAPVLVALEGSVRLLDAARRFGETTGALRELANQERWELANLLAGTARPRDWNWLKARWGALPQEASGSTLDTNLIARLRDVTASDSANEVTREMDSRMARRTRPVSMTPQLEQLLALLEDAARLLPAQLAAAREVIARTAPKMSERLAGLARQAEAMEKQTADHQQKSEQMELPTSQAKEAELLAQQEALARQIDELRGALRREANAQDMLNAEAREKARDADDADAMLRDPPHKAADRLRDAVAAEAMNDHTRSLAEANTEQTKTTQALQQLAEHFKNAEQGKAALSRADLRAAEEQLGMKALLEQRYSAAAALAELSKLSPEEQMAKLEEKLKESKPMQDELSAIMRAALESSAGLLNQAADDEKKLGDRLRDAGAREERQLPAAAAQAKKLQAEARQLAREDIPEAMQTAASAQAAADDSFLDAGKALKTAADAALAPTAVPAQMAEQLGQLTEPLRDALANLRDAAATTSKNAQRAPEDADAQTAKRQAAKAAAKAKALSDQAKQLQQSLMPSPEANAKAIADAGDKQTEIGTSVNEASDSLQRAARHDTRLSPAKAFEMMNLSGNVEMLAKGTLPMKEQELRASPTPQAAEPPARSAQKSIAEAAEAVEAALGGGKQGQSGEGKPENSGAQQEGKSMARALDQLDNAMNQQQKKGKADQPGQPGNKQSPAQAAQAAQQAMAGMAQAQQDAARESRAQQSNQSEGTGAEGYYAAKGEASGALPNGATAVGGEWGKLPPQLARELMEGQRDSGGGEYRSMIDIYFKVIAEKARASTP